MSVRRIAFATLAALAWSMPVASAPAIPSSYVPWPPQIQVMAPIDGVYRLIEMDNRGERVATQAQLWAGERARFPIVVTDGQTVYHVEVTGRGPATTTTTWMSLSYTGMWRVYAPVVR